MVFVKKLKGGRQIISYQKMKGSGLKAKTLKKILQATYENKDKTPSMIDDYIYFDDFSTDEVKVYGNEETNQIVVAVRGTSKTNPTDILTDLNLAGLNVPTTLSFPTFPSFSDVLSLPTSLPSLSSISPFVPTPIRQSNSSFLDLPRFKTAKDVLDRVIDYFHKGLDFKIDVIGHSLGGKVAYEISRDKPSDPTDTSLRPEINNVITVNSAGTLNDSETTNPFNKFDVRSENDFLANVGAIPPKPFIDRATGISNTIILNLTEDERADREAQIAINSPSGFEGVRTVFSPSTFSSVLEHKLDILDRIEDQNRVIGSGSSKNKISQYVNFILGVPK
jgi:hypothetical protein